MKITNKKDFLTLLKGATFLAAGGGGPYSLGKKIVEAYFKDIKNFEVDIVDPSLLRTNSWIAIAAGMGQPSASATFTAKAVVDPTVNAIKAMQQLITALLVNQNNSRFKDFKKFDALSAVEVGAINVAIPLICAHILKDNLIIVDGDPSGRSVPTIDLTPFAATQPVMPNMAASDGDEYEFTAMSLKNYKDLGTAYAKLMQAGLMGDVTGLCMAPMTRNTLNNGNIVNGTLSDAFNIGTIFEENISSDEKMLKIQDYLSCKAKTPRKMKHICTGRVNNYFTKTEDVTDLGYLSVQTDDDRVFTILIQNENIIGQFDDETSVTITGPDSICYITKTDGPLNDNDIYENVLISEKLAKGEEVYIHVVAIESADVVKENKKLMISWNEAYKTSRYYGPYCNKLWE